MKRVPTLLRSALALVAGVLFAFAAASPASAVPTTFAVSDLGEDYCTNYETKGEADWPDLIITPTVNITGTAVTWYFDDRPCLAVVPQPRHIEFLAYYEKEVVDGHNIPLSNQESEFDYSFSLRTASHKSITHVTVAICVTDSMIGQPRHDCTEPVRIPAN